jgi:ribosome-associated translation inhibitor RaiA
MKDLDFTIELNSQGIGDQAEAEIFVEADSRLRKLSRKHNDLTGAAINVRQPAQAATPFLYEVTVVVYARPKHIAATEKDADPIMALKNSLSAVERQVWKKREKLRERWQQPGNEPVSVEIETLMAAGEEGDFDA